MFSREELEYKISIALKIVHQFRWLLDSYITDFFVDSHWDKLPPSWSIALQGISPSELGEFVSGSPPKRLFPLSLLALKASVTGLNLRRRHSHNVIESHRKCKILSLSDGDLKGDPDRCRVSINNLMWKRIKKKKRHELSLMADLVGRAAETYDCHSVLDIGSGLGHLTRTLSLKYFINSVGIEAQNDLICGAREIDAQLHYTLSKYINDIELLERIQPQHVNLFLSTETRGSEIVTRLKSLPRPMNGPFGLTGLHTCGDLGPSLLKMFRETPKIKFVCIVGCCYMKLSHRSYPMSEHTRGLNDHHLSYESRELACHAVENYCDRLKKGHYQDLQIHCYRAALEKILVNKRPDVKHAALRSVKHYNNLSFKLYCEIATERLNVELDDKDIDNDEIRNYLRNWKNVVIFYTLRLILAPLVETIILWDRILYLMENDIHCEILPLFDPTLSPRNHVILAHK